METALKILNRVEPNGELLGTEQAIKAMELYAAQFQNQSSYEPLKKEILARMFRDKFDKTDSDLSGDFDYAIKVIEEALICDVDVDEMLSDLSVDYPRAVKAWKEERNAVH